MTQDDQTSFATMGTQWPPRTATRPQQASDLYITDGTIDDWMWATHKIFSYTFEMYPDQLRRRGFYPPDEEIVAQTTPQPGGGAALLRARRLRVPGDRQAGAVLRRRPPPTTVFSDNFETATGWTANPSGTDTATTGAWERGDPAATNSSGAKQLGTTVSGVNDLVTGAAAGAAAGDFDIDGGVTSIRSPAITLPASGTLSLTFS